MILMNNGEIKTLNIDDVLPNRFQPRIKFDEKAINELAESIKVYGVIQPIVVRKISDKYEIIAGERRYKASVLAGKTTIPAIIVDLNDKDSAEIALIENIQRQDLTPIEEAISYKKILDMGYLTQVTLGEKLGKTQSTIANKLRLLNLEDEVQDALIENKISERHARSLLKLKGQEQINMLNRVINERLTVRKLDEEIDKLVNNGDEKERDDNMNNDILNEMGIPTEPIVETPQPVEPVVEQPVVSEPVASAPIEPAEPTLSNLSFDAPTISDIQPTVNITNNEVNPGFMDVDKIQETAENIYKEPAPIADMDKLLDTSNNPKQEEPISPFQPVENASLMNNQDPSTVPGGGKFFTMFAKEEDTNPNFVKDIEGEKVNMDFATPEVKPTFEFNGPTNTPVSSVEPVVEQPVVSAPTEPVEPFAVPVQSEPVVSTPVEPVTPLNNIEENTNAMEDTPTFEMPSMPEPIQPNPVVSAPVEPELDPTKVFSMEQEVPQQELDKTMDFTQTFQPFSLNDDQTFTKEEQPTVEVPQPTIPTQPVVLDDMGEIKVQLPEETPKVDFKVVINDIRDLVSKIEKYGFTIDTDEVDFDDHYLVTFKIDKM